MTSSHIWPPKPSLLLTLICLCIVRRARPEWVAVSVRDAARAEGINAERISRLTTRVLAFFETAVGQFTRIGRRRKDSDTKGDKSGVENSELALTRALLDVATSILKSVELRKDTIRALIVGAYLRLRDAHPRLTQKRFCKSLALSERTLRSWLKKPTVSDIRPSPINDKPKLRPPRRRPPRRPRFGFAVTVSNNQFAADTTNLRAFGLQLKLVATQDIGGRDQDLLDAIIIDDHESADHVARVITRSLTDHPGAQLLSDQGTPYLAAKTREAIEKLEAEHAIQKEGDPLGKATLERAFRTAKDIAAPILAVTNRLASAFECLSQPDLAIAASTLLFTALLRAYQAGARASRRACAQRPTDTEQLVRVAEQSRERARANDRSARLLLADIYGTYQFDCSLTEFVNRFRKYPVSVLHQAERAFAPHAHRDDIRSHKSYFGYFVRNAHEDYRRRQARRWREQQEAQRLKRHRRRIEAERAAWRANPATWLRDCLDLVAMQWTGTTLLMDGAGVSGWIRDALARLTELHGPLATDVAAGVFRSFEQAYLPDIGPDGVAAVAAVLQRHTGVLRPLSKTTSPTAYFVATLRATGSTPRPPPSPDLC